MIHILLVISFLLTFFLGATLMALKDSIKALQDIADTLAISAQALIDLAVILKSNAVDPADIAAIDAVVVKLQGINDNLTAAVQ